MTSTKEAWKRWGEFQAGNRLVRNLGMAAIIHQPHEDPPDLVLELDNGLVGVEVRKLTDQDVRRNQQGFSSIAKALFNAYDQPPGLVVAVEVAVSTSPVDLFGDAVFPSGFDLPASRRRAMTAELLPLIEATAREFAVGDLGEFGVHRRLDLTGFPFWPSPSELEQWEKDRHGPFPVAFDHVRVRVSTEQSMRERFDRRRLHVAPSEATFENFILGHWKVETHTAWVVPHLSGEDLETVIDGKAEKLAEWTGGPFQERWLLLTCNGSPRSGFADTVEIDGEVLQHARDYAVTRGFDRVEVLDMTSTSEQPSALPG